MLKTKTNPVSYVSIDSLLRHVDYKPNVCLIVPSIITYISYYSLTSTLHSSGFSSSPQSCPPSLGYGFLNLFGHWLFLILKCLVVYSLLKDFTSLREMFWPVLTNFGYTGLPQTCLVRTTTVSDLKEWYKVWGWFTRVLRTPLYFSWHVRTSERSGEERKMDSGLLGS